MAYVISKACTKCGACLPECPTGSIIEGTTQYLIDTDTCGDHASCVNVCPVNAISLQAGLEQRKNLSLDEEEEED